MKYCTVCCLKWEINKKSRFLSLFIFLSLVFFFFFLALEMMLEVCCLSSFEKTFINGLCFTDFVSFTLWELNPNQAKTEQRKSSTLVNWAHQDDLGPFLVP